MATTIVQDGYKVTPGVCKHCGKSDQWRGVIGGVLCSCPFGTGFLHGDQDRRFQRTAEHTQSSYSFPRQASEQDQRQYNAGYSQAWRSDTAAPTLLAENTPEPRDPGATLGNTDAERNRLLYGGRRTELLKEGKTFDSERLNSSPLFAPTIQKLF